MKRLLRPGGRFSFVEISEPRNPLLRAIYLPYVRYVIPTLGAVLLGNPENYRQLGVYTKNFRNCRHVRDVFNDEGLETREFSLFFGCATGVEGEKPGGAEGEGARPVTGDSRDSRCGSSS